MGDSDKDQPKSGSGKRSRREETEEEKSKRKRRRNTEIENLRRKVNRARDKEKTAEANRARNEKRKANKEQRDKENKRKREQHQKHAEENNRLRRERYKLHAEELRRKRKERHGRNAEEDNRHSKDRRDAYNKQKQDKMEGFSLSAESQASFKVTREELKKFTDAINQKRGSKKECADANSDMFADANANLLKATLLFYLNSGCARFQEHKDYGKWFSLRQQVRSKDDEQTKLVCKLGDGEKIEVSDLDLYQELAETDLRKRVERSRHS